MCIYEKEGKCLFLVVATLMLVITLNLVLKGTKGNVGFTESEEIIEFCQNEKNTLGIYNRKFYAKDEKIEILIHWWEDSKGKKYFFLPSGSWRQQFIWVVPDSVSVWIEEKEIQSGDKFNLGEGIYTIVIEQNGIISECMLEILESSAIAAMFLDLETGDLEYIHKDKENEVSGEYVLFNANGDVENLGDVKRMRGRGNVSWLDSDKKGYQITLEKGRQLLGMASDKQWILIPNAFDNTLIRNKVCNNLAKGLGLEYTPNCEYIDLYIDGEYRGNYLLSEKIEIDDNRVSIRDLEKENEQLNDSMEQLCDFNIEKDNGLIFKGSIMKNEPEDISGGYLLELESPKRFESEKSGFVTVRGQCVTIQSPKYASENQVAYIAERYQCFENAIYSEDGCCPVDGRKFTEYIDLESFAKKYLLEELSKNHDAHITSQFFYKPEDALSNKIFAGPAWDYDKALGVETQNILGLDLNIPEGIHVGAQKREYDMWYGLCCQKEFCGEVYEIFINELEWIAKKEVDYSIPNLIKKIDDSVNMNHVRWGVYGDDSMEERISYWNEEVHDIQNFISDRIDFLKMEWIGQ